MAVAAVAMVGIAFWVYRQWGVPGITEVTPWGEATIDGRHVTLTYGGSACRSHASVRIKETDRQVSIAVRETVLGSDCNDMAVQYQVKGELKEPLGDREVVDEACLSDPWQSRPPCRAPREITIKD